MIKICQDHEKKICISYTEFQFIHSIIKSQGVPRLHNYTWRTARNNGFRRWNDRQSEIRCSIAKAIQEKRYEFIMKKAKVETKVIVLAFWQKCLYCNLASFLSGMDRYFNNFHTVCSHDVLPVHWLLCYIEDNFTSHDWCYIAWSVCTWLVKRGIRILSTDYIK